LGKRLARNWRRAVQEEYFRDKGVMSKWIIGNWCRLSVVGLLDIVKVSRAIVPPVIGGTQHLGR
jgi:hypothetical protein